ncbi:MAG: DUF6600 domain-containing protein [Geobacteraceae bacterium]
MKIRTVTLTLLSLVVLCSQAFSADLGLVRMGIVQGDVQIYSGDAKDWAPAAVNTPLTQGDRVWVPEGGRSELQVLGGIFIRLDAYSAFDILSLENNSYQFYLNSGRVYVNNLATQQEELLINTPVSSLDCSESSKVMIDVEDTGATEISVLQGYAYADTREGRIRIPSGKTLRIGEDLRTEIFPLNATGEWEEWNLDLDRRISIYDESDRYLPEKLDTYSYDFDANGRWLYDSSYGYVWTPFISVSLDWAPYHDGRWVWIGGNYVWISSERWGWVPYHYGRWIFLQHSGWCWVPPRRGAVYWGPGYVGWVYTPNYVSWIPLAPGETYYGHGYYGPGSVNINILAHDKFPTKRDYRNMHARNAIKVLHRDTFLRGKYMSVPRTVNPFSERNVGIGPPRFKPDRETYAPKLMKIPEAKRPPQKFRNVSPDSLRKERNSIPGKRGLFIRPTIPQREQPPSSRETPKRNLREQQPDIYTDRLSNQEGRHQQQNDQLRRELPVERNQSAPLFTQPAPRRIQEKGTPAGSRQQRQPATIRVAPQPVAPQPVAPTPVWSPSQPRQQEQKRSPATQQQRRAPVTIRNSGPATIHAPAAVEQPRQQQRPPQQFIRQAPKVNQPTIRTAPRQGTTNQHQQRTQIIQQQKPVTVQPGVGQTPARRERSPATRPDSWQQRGNSGEHPAFQWGERKGGIH